MGNVTAWVPVFISILLSEDCSGGEFRCVRFNGEWFCWVGHEEYQGFCEFCLWRFERCLILSGPFKDSGFLYQFIQWVCRFHEAFNESPIGVPLSPERILLLFGGLPSWSNIDSASLLVLLPPREFFCCQQVLPLVILSSRSPPLIGIQTFIFALRVFAWGFSLRL